jgi:tetratricopeptide (TPR) repeat protein
MKRTLFANKKKGISKRNFFNIKYPVELGRGSWVSKAQTAIFLQEAAPNADRFYASGFCFYQLRKPEEAFEAFRQALKLNPHHSGALYFSAAILSAKQKYYEALDYLQNIRDHTPPQNLPLAPHYWDKMEETVSALQEYWNYVPHSVESSEDPEWLYSISVRLYNFSSSFAPEFIDKAIKLSPTCAKYYLHRGDIYFKYGYDELENFNQPQLLQQAHEDYTTALKMDPKEAQHHLRMGYWNVTNKYNLEGTIYDEGLNLAKDANTLGEAYFLSLCIYNSVIVD